MNSIKTTAAAIAIAGASVIGAGAMTPTAEAAGTAYGCPYGAVCVYEEDGWAQRQPEYVWFSLGGHNLDNEWGRMAIVNNQYDGAGLVMCSGYDGQGEPLWVLHGPFDGGSAANFQGFPPGEVWRSWFVADEVNSVELLPGGFEHDFC